MNQKTAKLIRKWARHRQVHYRNAKKKFLKRSKPDRAELRQDMKEDIARFEARR